MKVKNSRSLWERYVEINVDAYSACTIRYAERWADLMEERMAQGEALESIAKETSYEADTEAITGFMYGMAAAILSQYWEHGEGLRRWHNLDSQIADEGQRANESGGVLNPALLNIGV